MSNQTVEAELVQPTQALAVRESGAVATTGVFNGGPAEVIKQATEAANALKHVIVSQGLVSKISGKEYPRCEAWTLLGTIVGVFPVLAWTKPIEGGWEARVEARTKAGEIVGAAEAECLRSERNWSNRDDFAIRSMAQTRATAKALRMPLGFVMTLAGFEATPAEEMALDHPRNGGKPSAASRTASPESGKVQSTTPPQQNAPQGNLGVKSPVQATQKTLEWALEHLHARLGEPARDIVSEFFTKCGALLRDLEGGGGEQLEDLPLEFVPVNKTELADLAKAIAAFEAGEPAQMPYKHAMETHATPSGKPKPEAERAINPDWLTIDGVVENVNLKEGKNAKGPWSLWGIKMYGNWYNTFSNRIGTIARDAYHEKRSVTLYYSEGEKGNTAEEIE